MTKSNRALPPAPRVVTQAAARRDMQLGINRMTDVLARTLGPTGTPVVADGNIGNKLDFLDDAATIVRRIISLGDPRLDIGAMILRNVVWRVDQLAGDGGAMTAVFMRAIFEAGLRQITAGANAMQLTRGIRLGLDAAVAALTAQAQAGGDETQLAAVARSVTRDDDLAWVLGEMSYLLGPDAHVQIETYVAPYLQRVYIAGAVYGAKIASAYLYTEPERKRAAHAAPAVAVLDHPLTTTEQAIALLQATLDNQRAALLIIAPNISGAALALLAANHALPAEKRKVAVLAVSLTAIGAERDWTLDDLSLLTGATVLGNQAGHSAERATAADLGKAQRVEFASERLALEIEPARRSPVQTEIAHVRSRLQPMLLNDAQRPALVRRLATLTGGIGVLKVGAHSKLGQELRRTQAERALKVLSAVQHGGVVAGGGAALAHCAAAVRRQAAESPAAMDDDVRLGVQVLADALVAPLRQILTNAGVDAPAVAIERVIAGGPQVTYDVIQQKVVDAWDAGVLDAAGVLTVVLQTAVSAALMALSTDAIVYHRNPERSLEP